MTPSLWQKVKKNYEVKEESKKVGLKLNIQKMKIMASGPITSWEICMQVRKQQLELDMEPQTDSK